VASKSIAASDGSSTTRHVSLAGSHLPFQLVENFLDAAGNPVPAPKGAAAAPKAAVAPASNAAASAGDDPTGIKGYIAFSVAHALYPKGDGIDPDYPIATDIKLNGPSIAAEINVDAQHSATMHHFTWKSVTADDLSGLATVSDLVKLVQNNLSTPAAS
jgi:hypothetical protein